MYREREREREIHIHVGRDHTCWNSRARYSALCEAAVAENVNGSIWHNFGISETQCSQQHVVCNEMHGHYAQSPY